MPDTDTDAKRATFQLTAREHVTIRLALLNYEMLDPGAVELEAIEEVRSTIGHTFDHEYTDPPSPARPGTVGAMMESNAKARRP